MFNRILVPLDGSQLAELVFPYAEELAGAFNSEVTVVHVCETAEHEHRHMYQLYVEQMARMLDESIKKAGSVAAVKPLILDGKPAAGIIDYARENDVGLIIMATHGRSGIMLWTMGSVAQKLLEGIAMPVLLIRASTPALKKEELFSKILVPLDGSEAGEAVLPYIEELTKKLKSEVILLQVVAPGQHVRTVGGLDYIYFDEHSIESMKTKTRQYLEEASTKLKGTKAAISSEVRFGDASEEIIKLVKETDSHLVAISTHGHSGVRRWSFGSVAQKVLHAGSAPVLLVRAPG